MMRAVECDKSHAADINSLADALNEIVLDFAVVHVTPPKKDIGVIEHLIRQSLIGIVKRRKGDLHIVVLREKLADRRMKSVRIKLCDILVALLVSVLVPDRYVDCFCHILIPPKYGFTYVAT